jgi:acetylornithine deacetylase/succinyl-diaminopimelate desuccinylase family protein
LSCAAHLQNHRRKINRYGFEDFHLPIINIFYKIATVNIGHHYLLCRLKKFMHSQMRRLSMKIEQTSPLDILNRLIRFDTSNPPGNEAPLAGQIADMLGKSGFDVLTQPCGENRASVIARLRRGSGKKLVFNGHLDVVPCGEGWSANPFEPRLDGDKLYGRGAADMKGGVASIIHAGMLIAKNWGIFGGELILNFVADEELHNLGTLSSRSCWEDADYVIVGEPSELEIHIAHRGTARFEIAFNGKSCHSGLPQDGINAIEKAAEAVLAIRGYNETLSKITHPILPSPSAVVTMAHGGRKDNVIPDSCIINVDRRMILGETGASAERELRRLLDAIGEKDVDFSYTLDRYICLDAGGVKQDSDIVLKAKAAYGKCFGKEPVVRDFPATCEQVIFTSENIPAIIFGPGSIEQAHVKDEFVEIGQLEEASIFYRAFAEEVFGYRSAELPTGLCGAKTDQKARPYL